MKRFFKVIMWVGLFFLYGCTTDPIEPTTPTVDTIPHEVQDYQITASTFETFFTIDPELILTGGSYQLSLKIRDNHQVVSTDVDFSITIYFSYFDGYTQRMYAHETEDTLLGSHYQDTIPMVSLHPTMNPVIHYVMVNVASGHYRTYRQVDVIQKTYAIPNLDGDIFNVGDITENKRVMDAWEAAIATVMGKSEQSTIYEEDIAIKISTTGDTMDYQMTTLIKADPTDNYLEITQSGTTIIFKIIDSRMFAYPLDNYNIFSQMYSIDAFVVPESDLSQLYGINPIPSDTDYAPYQYNYMSVKFTETHDGYFLEGYLKDFMTASEYKAILSMYQSIGATSQKLDKTMLRVSYKLTEDSFEVTTKYRIMVEGEYIYSISNEVTQKMTFRTFEKHNLEDTSKYYIYPPSEMIEVTEISFVNEDISQPYSPQPDYYMAYFDAGQYVYVPDKKSTRVEIYDIDGKKMSFKDAYIMDENNYIFYVEAGYYFIKVISVSTQTTYGYTFRIDDLDYETSAFTESATEIQEGLNTIVIEGAHDAVKMTVDLSDPIVLKIHYLNMDTELQINYWVDSSKIHREWWQKDSFYYLDLPVNQTTIYFRANAAGTYHFEVTEIKLKEVQESPYPSITDQFEGPLIVLNTEISLYLMSLEVTEKSFVEFYFEKFEQVSNFVVLYIFSAYENLTPQGLYGSHAKIVLEPGIYTVHVETLRLSVTRVRADMSPYQSLEIKHVDIQSSLTMDPHSDGFPSIDLFHYNNEHQIQAWFTLEEDATIFIGNTTSYTLHHASGQPISFYRRTMTRISGNYYRLEAGTYYIQHINVWHNQARVYTVLFSIILEEVVDDNLFGSQVPLVGLGTYTYQKDRYYDEEMVKFEVGVSGIYHISTNQFTYLYQADGTYISSSFTSITATLEPGIYYIWMPNYSSDIWTFTIQKN